MTGDISDKKVLTAYPRRNARLVSHFLGIFAGLFFIFFPPLTTINFLETPAPARAWGVFLVVGGLTSSWAWFSRTLIVDRIGISLTIIGLTTLTMNQTLLFFDGPTWTRGGGTVVLLMLLSGLVSRWQDVHLGEKLGMEADDYEKR